jgi:hypothetical protein
MYPGPSGSPENHKRGYCSDGVKRTMQGDKVPDWPQPQGIFERGLTFDPFKFLSTVREAFEEYVIHGGDGGDRAMEFQAFANMLHTRTKFTADGHCLFKLFDLEVPLSTPQDLVVEYEGSHHLRMDCLRNDEGASTSGSR